MSKKRYHKDLTQIEAHARTLGYHCIAGLDEAGRGPLAGPVVAAACIIPAAIQLDVDDSKQLKTEQREQLYAEILSISKIDYGIGIVEHNVIDAINILQASLKAMRLALSHLKQKPDFLLVDGLHLPTQEIPGLPIVEGDSKVRAIAAASILAKVTRDRLMCEYHLQWPQYGFDAHKGYAVPAHLAAIAKHGPCPIHRLSFHPFKTT
jgi:ribonuclease HII